MKSLYSAGDSFLHRMPAGAKIAGLALVATAVFLTRQPLVLGAVMLAAAAIYFSLGQSIAAATHTLRPVFATIVLVGIAHLLFTGTEQAMVTTLRLTILMLLGAAVTLTTTVQAFMDVVTCAAAPLERIGLVKAADIGLAVGLVVRFVPEILSRYEAIREAHVARGLKPRAMTVIGPLIISTLKDADNIAAAIDARGIRGQ